MRINILFLILGPLARHRGGVHGASKAALSTLTDSQADVGKPFPNVLQLGPSRFEKKLVADMDDTLYDLSCNIRSQFDTVLKEYAQKILRCPPEVAAERISHYYGTYGLTIKGMLAEVGNFDHSDYDDFVHSRIDYAPIAARDEGGRLRDFLALLRADLVIFTNGSLRHTMSCLEALQITDMVHQIIYVDFGEKAFPSKPEQAAFHRAAAALSGTPRGQIYFIDDSAANIATGKLFGWQTIRVIEGCSHTVEPDESGARGRCVAKKSMASKAVMRKPLCTTRLPGRAHHVIPSIFYLSTSHPHLFADAKVNGTVVSSDEEEVTEK